MRIDEIQWTSNCGCGEGSCAGLFAEMAVPGGVLVITTSHDEDDDVYRVACRNSDPARAFPVTKMTAAEVELLLPPRQELPPPPALVP